MPVEGLSALEIRERHGSVRDMMPAPSDHFQCGLGKGCHTDDTEETLILAESMLASHGFSGDRFAEGLRTWGSSWSLDERLCHGVGLATRSAVLALIEGADWRTSGASIPTCGSAMRAAPIGLVYHCDLDLISMYAQLQSIPTHRSPQARAGAVAVAVGVALATMGFPRRHILDVATAISSKVSQEFSASLHRAGDLLTAEPREALDEIGNSPEVSETVPAAFYCFMKFEPEDALIAAASSGGDTDTIAAITGALAGAASGTGWIPDRWLSALVARERMEDAASRLSDLSCVICNMD